MPVSRLIRHRHSTKEIITCYKCRFTSKYVKEFSMCNGLPVCLECVRKRKYGLYKYLAFMKNKQTACLSVNSGNYFTNSNNCSTGMKKNATSTSKTKSSSPMHDKNISCNPELIKLNNSLPSKASTYTISATSTYRLRAVILAILAVVGPYIIFCDLGFFSKPDVPQVLDYSSNIIEDFTNQWQKPELETLLKYDSNICTIDKVHAHEITVDQFNQKYRQKKPVIIKFYNGASEWTNISQWALPNLIKNYGSHPLYAGKPREIVRHGGNGDFATTLEYYVEQLMKSYRPTTEETQLYVFDRSFYKLSMLEINPPSYLHINDGIDDSMFFLGTSKSGVSFHKHAEGWNAVVFGKKRWFLYPKTKMPPGGMYPGYSQLDWYHHIYPNLTSDDKPIECIQNAGEILYLPESMYHSTINLGDTIAVGIQKRQAVSPEETLFYKDNRFERQGSVNKRLTVLQELKTLLPDNGEVDLKLGQVYEQLSDYTTAEHYYQQAIDLDPYFLVALLNLARIKSKLNETKKADDIFQHVINLNPNMWDVYADYGTFLINQNRYREALHFFQKGTELQPLMRTFWDYLRYCQELVGDWEAAKISQKHLSSFDGHG